MKFFDKLIKKKEKKPTIPEHECEDGHNCETLAQVDDTMFDAGERIKKIMQKMEQNGFGKLIKED